MNTVTAIFLYSAFSFHHLLVESSILDCPSVVAENVCPNDNIFYWLYNNEISAYNLNVKNSSSITNAPFLSGVKTVFLLNGFNGTRDTQISEIRPPYINKGYNVIMVDYSALVPFPCYIQAVANVNLIARCFADFFKLLLSFQKISLTQVHVLGFSLGAQIAGRVGKDLIKDGVTLPRITALDAAAPLFYWPFSNIDETSAAFVDTIHTNSLIYGKILPIGHVDFYCNDIVYQPQCINLTLGSLVLCSHLFANTYYAESITKTHYFCGTKLMGTDKERMGEYVSTSARGVYTVKTNKEYPYAGNTTC